MVENSKWFLGFKEYLKVKKKKEARTILIGFGIGILINITLMVIYRMQRSYVDEVLAFLIVLLFILTFILFFLLLKRMLSDKTKIVAQKLSKVLTSMEDIEQFDRELLGEPKAISDNGLWRCIFTEHYMLS